MSQELQYRGAERADSASGVVTHALAALNIRGLNNNLIQL